MTTDTQSTTGGASGRSNEAWVLASLGLPVLMVSMDNGIANAGLPVVAKVFGATFAEVQWVALAYLLALTALIVGAGRLGDIVGQRRLLVAGLLLFAAASALSSAAASLAILMLGRAAQGVGAAVMLALSMALVSAAVPKPRTGWAMGLLGTLSALGTSFGPSVGGLLIDTFGWRAMFLANLPLGVVALALVLRSLPELDERQARVRPTFDVVGTLLLAGTLIAYALALTTGRRGFGLLTTGLLATAAAGLWLFVRAQVASPAPLVRLAMLRDPTLGAGYLTSLLIATVMMSTLVVGPFYLSAALALRPSEVGLVMAIGPLAAAIAGVFAGRLVEQAGGRRVMLAALAGLTIGLAALSTAPEAFGVRGYVVSIVFVTISYALFQTANNSSVMAAAGDYERGVTSGMLGLSRNLGLITGASAMGALFASASGAADIASASGEAIAAGMLTTFAVAALLALAALGIAISVRSREDLGPAQA